MDQIQTPILDALAAVERRPAIGFGAPGHHQGQAIPRGLKRLIGARAFQADTLTPKGLDDRTESLAAVQRAHEIAAEAWGADIARFVTGGSSQSIRTALAGVARPGETVVLASNSHKAEFAACLAGGLNPVVAPVTVDAEWDLEHGVPVATLERTLAEHPDAKAVVVVSPTYFGVTCDIARLAAVAHARRVPLIVDAAWGGAFGFSPRLPANPLALGADIAVASLHKTMGGLGQGSILLARGNLVDQERLALAFELFETTSPSVPILASLDATRRDHATKGAALWADLLDLAGELRAELAKVAGVPIWRRERLDGDGAFDLDESKVTLDIARLGVAGYAADDWLYAKHRINIGLSDAHHLLAIIGLGTSRSDIRHLAAGVADLVEKLSADRTILPPAPAVPRAGALGFEMAMPGPDAFFAACEKVRYEEAEGRIAAEIIAPAPPGVPRLVPGQRISAAHVHFLVAHRNAGAFILDPADPSEHQIRVVA